MSEQNTEYNQKQEIFDGVLLESTRCVDSGIEFSFSGAGLGQFTSSFAQEFKQTGSTNYLQTQFKDLDDGAIYMATIQKLSGLTPQQKCDLAEVKSDALLEALKTLAREFGEVGSDGCYSAKVCVELLGCIRTLMGASEDAKPQERHGVVDVDGGPMHLFVGAFFERLKDDVPAKQIEVTFTDHSDGEAYRVAIELSPDVTPAQKRNLAEKKVNELITALMPVEQACNGEPVDGVYIVTVDSDVVDNINALIEGC